MLEVLVFYCDPSFYISLGSLLSGLAALIIAFCVARRDSRHHFEQTVESCLMPISVFIQDSAVIISNKLFSSSRQLIEGEKRLIEGINQLYVFSQTNNYQKLGEFATINFGDMNKNIRSFSYCFFTLEHKYVEFRKANNSGIVKEAEEKFIASCNLHFREYLNLLSKYLFKLKKRNYSGCLFDYYDELKNIFKKVEELKYEN